MRRPISHFHYNVALFSIFFLSSILVGCNKLDFLKPKKAAKDKASSITVKGTVIAKVSNYPITLEGLNQEIETYNSLVSKNYPDKPELKVTTKDQKVAYLKNEIVRRVLLSQEAEVRGLDKKEDVEQALENAKQNLLALSLVRQESEGVDVTSAEIEDYYNRFKGELKEPEERRIREIMVTSEQEAKDILIALLQGQDFATLARERSKAASAKDGGDIGFIQKGKKFPQFDAVAFSDTLEVGKVSNIFKGPAGDSYILKLEAIKGGKQKTLSEIWDDIKRLLIFLKQQKKIEDLYGKLSREAKLEFYEGEIK